MAIVKHIKYFVQTWGCQMNHRDSEIIGGMLEEIGMIPESSPEHADVVVLNTCCIREKAELKVYGRIGELARYKRENPQMVIVVCGCMVQQKGVPEHIIRRFPQVNLIVGTHNLYRLPELLQNTEGKSTLIEVFQERPADMPDSSFHSQKTGLKAKVNISFGCNNFCSYCIVPYVRGREVSRRPQVILDEIAYLAANGCKEVLLLGQNVNSYGKDNDSFPDFSDLLLLVAGIDGIDRIRFMTSHPKDFSDKLIETIAGNAKICNHVHLPAQAGSNGILKAMNRGYTRERYINLAEKIKRTIPSVSLTTDIIVGFPGEREEDFQDSLSLLAQVQFDSAYTFMYSSRKGTKAADLGDELSAEIKKERLDRLMDLQDEISLDLNLPLEGQKVEILVDTRKNGRDGGIIYSGRTTTNKVVVVDDPGDRELMGQLLTVEITNAKTWSLKGQLN